MPETRISPTLAQSQWLQQAWDNAPVAYLAVDTSTHTVVAANKAAQTLCGWPESDLTGTMFTAIFSPENQNGIAAFLRSPASSVPLQVELRTRSGLAQNMALRKFPATATPADQVHVVSIRSMVEPITADRLRRLNWAVQAYAQSMSALTHAHDIETLTRTVCQAIVSNGIYRLAWCGVAESGTGKPIRMVSSAGPAIGYMEGLNLSWSEDVPEGRGPTGIAIRSGQPQVMRDSLSDPTFALWRDKGLRFNIRSSVTVPFQRNHVVRGALMVYASEPDAFGPDEMSLFARLGEEVAFAIEADNRRAELAMTEAKFTRLVSTTPTPIIGVALDSTIQIFNAAAEQVFEYTAAEAIGQSLDILIPTESVGPHRHLLRHYATTESASRKMAPIRELSGRKRSGAAFPIEVIISKIDTAEGPLMTAIVRDLTEQKELQNRLVQSEKMEAFGQLAGGIAHDFNNLLAVISGNAELIRDKSTLEAPARRNLDLIESACTHGADLTRRLLVFSRKAAPKPTIIDVAAIVREVAAILRYTLNANIHVSANIENQNVYVVADAALLQTSLLNLCINARDAMPQGGTLTLRVARATDDITGHDIVSIAVQDTGMGIPPDTLNQIFEPFFTTKPEGKGTGLGLSMVYGFTQQANGRIDVTSTVGKGTCFTLRLPASNTGTQPADTAITREVADLRHVRILYVEDNEDLRDTSTIRLNMLGADVIAVDNPRDALRIAASGERFQILLTDLQLSDSMSGIELARTLCQQRPDLGVAITTGYLDSEDAAQIQPGWVVLEKPVISESLVVAISQLARRAAHIANA